MALLTGSKKIKTAVFISGSGSNLNSLIKFSKLKKSPISIDLNKINTSKIFKWLNKNGVSNKEMLKTFNCGVGFCLIINPKKLDRIKTHFTNGFKPYVIGKITKNIKDKVKLNGSVNWI